MQALPPIRGMATTQDMAQDHMSTPMAAVSDTPGIQRPTTPCRTCHQPTTNTGARCDTCRRTKNQHHNQRQAYYQTPEWRTLREQCRAASYNQCCLCTSTYRLTAHHIIPRKDGGADALHNLACLCHHCHSRIETGNKHTHALLAEYLRIRPPL